MSTITNRQQAYYDSVIEDMDAGRISFDEVLANRVVSHYREQYDQAIEALWDAESTAAYYWDSIEILMEAVEQSDDDPDTPRVYQKDTSQILSELMVMLEQHDYWTEARFQMTDAALS